MTSLGINLVSRDVLEERKQVSEAEKLYRQVLEGRRQRLPAQHLDLASALGSLGNLLSDTGRAQEAEPLLRECLAICENKLPRAHWRIAQARSMLGASLARQKQFAEAEPLLVSGCDGLSAAPAKPARELARAFDRVIDLYEKSGKPGQAKLWRKKRPANKN